MLKMAIMGAGSIANKMAATITKMKDVYKRQELIGMSDRIMVMANGKVKGELEGEETASQQAIMNLAFGGNEQ